VAREWEPTLRTWKNPPSDTEDQKRDRTQEQIRAALRVSQALKTAGLQVYAKGSYKNNTNVRLDYDVDIAAECTAFYFYDQIEAAEGLDPSMVGVEPYSGSYTKEAFKRDVEAALVAEFGRRAVTPGKIAFRIRESRLTLPADVVPCFSYRLIYGRNLDGSPRYEPGHCVFPQGRAPAFSRFVMIRPIHSARPRSSEHCFCAGQGAAGSSTTIRTYTS